VGKEAGEDPEIVRPEPVREVVEPDGVETGVAEEDLEHAARCGIPLEDDLDVVPDRSEHLPSLEINIIRQIRSIIRYFRKKWKDFLQSLLLDPLDVEKIHGGTELAETIPLLHYRGGYLVGNPGELRDLRQGSFIDIYPFTKEIFLADREGAASGTLPGKEGRFVVGGGRQDRRIVGPVHRREKPDRDDVLRRGERIPDQQDQGKKEYGASFPAATPFAPRNRHAASSTVYTGCCPPGPAKTPR
jgi:hypothetical protein